MWDRILYTCRIPTAVTAILITIYIASSLWTLVPQTDFEFYWRPDDRLMIRSVPPESLAAPYLMAEDIVVAIEGREVHRAAALYTGPIRTSYEYTVQRGNEILVLDVPFTGSPTSIGISYRVPVMVLTSVFLLVGVIVLRFASQENIVAVRVGYVFLVSAVAVIGLLGELVSVTGAWLSRSLWFFAHVGALYLGFVPHLRPLSPKVSRAFRWLLVVAGLLNIGAVLEAAVLFPQHMSLDRVVGAGFYEFALLASGASWMIALGTLVFRAYRMPSSYERQQVIILLFLISLAVLPVTFLTLVPRALLDVVLVPFPVAIALFVLVPAGFFFVIYRRGYLGLDIVFSKTTIFLTTALILLTLYSSGLHFANQWFNFGSNFVLPASLMLVPILMLASYVNQPVNHWISTLLFGPVTTNRSLPEFANALSTRPELTTLAAIVTSLARDLQVPQALLVLRNESGILTPVAQVNVTDWRLEQVAYDSFHKPLLRSSARSKTVHPLFDYFPWLELLLPIVVRHEQIGFLAMSRPREGYFNAEHILFLSRVADMIAVGSEAILLFEASRKLSLQLLSAQEVERKRIATQIHDRPLQIITFVHHNLRRVLANPANCTPEAADTLTIQAENLQTTMTELREICAGLYPPVIEQGLELVIREVGVHFIEQFGLEIEEKIDLPADITSSPEFATAVYRVLTESLNNVVKHSQTRCVNVSLSCYNSLLTLTIADNGIGSAIPSLSITELTRQQHMGIRGMFEWARLVNGTLSIEDNQPRGTRVKLEIPINHQGM